MQNNRHIVTSIKLLLLILAVVLGLAVLVYAAESTSSTTTIDSYPNAVWYTVVTLSTVGYGDMYPTTTLGRIAGGITIICAVCFIGYAVGRLGEQLLENSRRKFLGMNGTTFTDHYVILGWSELSRIVIGEILAAGFPVAVLAESEHDITEIRAAFEAYEKKLFVSFGQFESETAFDRVNLAHACGVILLCNDDTRTLVTVLRVRELRPDVKITAYIENARLRKTVENAGVSYVVSPNEVIGRMIASATFEPDVGTFLEDVLSTTTGADDLDIQEYRLGPGHELVGASFGTAYDALAVRCAARLLTFSRREGTRWRVAKSLDAEQPLAADDYLILLANADAARALRSYLGVAQGRRV